MGHIGDGRSRKDRSRPSPPYAGAKRRVFVHINNSNPALREDSPERSRGGTRRAGKSPGTAWRLSYEQRRDAPISSRRRSPQVGAERYHNKHPFHHLLHGGKLNKGQVQAWALNRYCYRQPYRARTRPS